MYKLILLILSHWGTTLSDDGRDSFKKGQSSFSYSDSVSNFSENTPLDSKGVVNVFPSSVQTGIID